MHSDNQQPDLAFVDIETGGLNPRRHAIVEIAVLRVDAITFEHKDVFERRCKPLKKVGRKAAQINGYSWAAWTDAYELADCLVQAFRLIRGARWVGSKPSFDHKFLKVAAREQGIEFPALARRRLVDISSMAEPWIRAGAVKGSGLDALSEAIGLPPRGLPHRAYHDAVRTLAVYQRLCLSFYPHRGAR